MESTDKTGDPYESTITSVDPWLLKTEPDPPNPDGEPYPDPTDSITTVGLRAGLTNPVGEPYPDSTGTWKLGLKAGLPVGDP